LDNFWYYGSFACGELNTRREKHMNKVLHVLTDTNIGGAGRYLFNLLAGLPSKKYEFFVACPGGGELEKELKAREIRYFTLTGGESSLSFKHVKEILRIIKKERIDIVHTHASLSGRIAGRMAGCRVILTRHGLDIKNKGLIKRLIAYIIARIFTDKIIAISRAVKINLIETGVPADMIKIIHNGIDLSRFDLIEPTLRLELGLSNDTTIIGVVARIVGEKGYEYILKAMPKVLELHPSALLVIVGDGPLKAQMQELAGKLGIYENTIFLGYRRDVEKLVADFDLFVLPSINEGLGLSLLEAMALGKPVIATEVGGIPEVIKNGKNGLLIPPGDEKALAMAILKILSSKDFSRKLGQVAKETVYEKFSAISMAQKTVELYDDILRMNGDPSR